MGKLTDEQMQEIKDKLAKRRAGRAKQGVRLLDTDIEVRNNITGYCILEQRGRDGYVTLAETTTEEAIRAEYAKLPRGHRALMYVVGKLPSRGIDTTAMSILDQGLDY